MAGTFAIRLGHPAGHQETRLNAWEVQDAELRFSEFLEACLSEGPQTVIRCGAEAAVLVSVEEWRRLQSAARPSLKQLLLCDGGRGDLSLPARQHAGRRHSGPAE